MIIYAKAPNWICNTINDGTMHTYNVPEFDGKCKEYIEGYRFVPAGETWVREDGAEFTGEMISPWKPYEELAAAQAQYEHEQYAAVTAERDALLEYIENEEFTTDELGNRYRKEVGTDGEIHLVLIESFTGELYQ